MGAEAAVHAARSYLHNMQSNQLLLKIDFRNAFNSIRRDKMLLSVLEYAPEIYPLVFSAYRNPSYLFFDNNIVESAEGVQQGDSLGPLLFSLTIHHLLSHLAAELKVFYLDDGTLGGTIEEVVGDLQKLEEAADTLGLVLNHQKSEVICSEPSTRNSMLASSPDLKCVDSNDACLLGSPIGGTIEEVVGDLQKLEEAADTLGLVLNHQKSEVICSEPSTRNSMLASSPDLKCVDSNDACLLGSPIGGRQSLDDVLAATCVLPY